MVKPRPTSDLADRVDADRSPGKARPEMSVNAKLPPPVLDAKTWLIEFDVEPSPGCKNGPRAAEEPDWSAADSDVPVGKKRMCPLPFSRHWVKDIAAQHGQPVTPCDPNCFGRTVDPHGGHTLVAERAYEPARAAPQVDRGPGASVNEQRVVVFGCATGPAFDLHR